MTELNDNDYKRILEYYNKQIPKSKKSLKTQAEKLLANKLCRCIKKVDKKNEARAIGICAKTVINHKGLRYKKFTCKKKKFINLKKKNLTKKNKN